MCSRRPTLRAVKSSSHCFGTRRNVAVRRLCVVSTDFGTGEKVRATTTRGQVRDGCRDATYKRVNSLLRLKNLVVTSVVKRIACAYTFIHAKARRNFVRILIADDHPIVRHGPSRYWRATPSATVVGKRATATRRWNCARKVEWDMAIFDFTMPRT